MALAAVLVGAIALALTLWQFINRHRPFVGVSSLSVNQGLAESDLGYLDVEFTNYGEVQGHDVLIEISFPGYASSEDRHGLRFGVVSPTQTGHGSWLLPKGAKVEMKSSKLPLAADVRITYRAPGAWSVRRLSCGHHSAEQEMWVDLQGKWALYGEEQYDD